MCSRIAYVRIATTECLDLIRGEVISIFCPMVLSLLLLVVLLCLFCVLFAHFSHHSSFHNIVHLYYILFLVTFCSPFDDPPKRTNLIRCANRHFSMATLAPSIYLFLYRQALPGFRWQRIQSALLLHFRS